MSTNATRMSIIDCVYWHLGIQIQAMFENVFFTKKPNTAILQTFQVALEGGSAWQKFLGAFGQVITPSSHFDKSYNPLFPTNLNVKIRTSVATSQEAAARDLTYKHMLNISDDKNILLLTKNGYTFGAKIPLKLCCVHTLHAVVNLTINLHMLVAKMFLKVILLCLEGKISCWFPATTAFLLESSHASMYTACDFMFKDNMKQGMTQNQS